MTQEEIKAQKKNIEDAMEVIARKQVRLTEAAIEVRAHLWRLQNLVCRHQSSESKELDNNIGIWRWGHCLDCGLDLRYTYEM